MSPTPSPGVSHLNLYGNVSRAVLLNILKGDFFRIMQEVLQDHHTSFSDIDLMGGITSDIQDLTNSLYERVVAYGM
ncbi:hypothetical protein DPMN_061155 [Dreissena polymorpha]|uniref:Uncharacterized protein n=1 Tax=Dreissena polymorpha TaxID=45954 RepID=A0A9D4HGV5_DREPO|nr:hypothetical protein DPMN_061155 [Dreissena polymorpha]